MKYITFLGILVLVYCWEPCETNQGYLVVCPSAFRPSVEEVVSVTVLKPSEPILVTAKLYTEDGKLLAKSDEEIFGKGRIRLQVPQDARGKATLKVCGNCQFPKEGVFTFYNSTTVTIEERGSTVFIQTDKPVYKPGQRVFINIITMKPDLRPLQEKMLVYIVDPRGSRIAQWDNLKSFCCGIVNVSFPLSDQPILGKWIIFAEMQGHKYNKTFEIQKYVLPKFEISIEAPSFVKDWNACESIVVNARYLYGKPVSGNLSATVTVQGDGYYQDFKGLKTVLNSWIDGVATFNVCVMQLFPYEVGSHFRGVLYVEAMVTADDGSVGKAADSSCIISRPLVDIEFSKDTRKHFKPGLPYRGKVRTLFPDGSPADNITVQIRTDVNGEDFSVQEILSRDGKAVFEIPPLPRMAQSVWLDAKVLRVQGKDVSQSYFSSYLSLTSWYSPTSCHLLVEGRTAEYEIGDQANFNVLSTCMCNFTLYYEVLARGNIVTSGMVLPAEHQGQRAKKNGTQIPLKDTDDQKAGIPLRLSSYNCSAKFKLPISHQMAPFARLLVYYVKESGEGVADTVVLSVKPGYQNKVSVGVAKKSLSPGDQLKLHIKAKPSSCVCLAAVDRSVHLLKPGFQVTTEQIFEELEYFDLTEQHEDTYWWGLSRRRRRKRSATPWWTFFRSRDTNYAFEEAGLIVMTDSVSLNHRQDPRSFQGPMFQKPGSGFLPLAAFSSPFTMHGSNRIDRRKRTYFPETWIWTCFNTSSTRGLETLRVQLPDSITTWNIQPWAMSEKHGLALGDAVQVGTFKEFFVDFTLPYSVIRGEQVKIPVTVYNYLNTCAEVYIKMKVPRGVTFMASKQHIYSLKMCVGNQETKTISPVLVFKRIGTINMTVHAEAYADIGCCTNEASGGQREITGADHITRQILAEPEGIEKHYTHSVFFCPNERIHLSTPNKYEFQYVKMPISTSTFSFAAKAHNDVHLALSSQPKDNADMLEIVVGGLLNTHSWIAHGKGGDQLVNVPSKDIVTWDQFTMFWVSWTDGLVRVGLGEHMENGSVLMQYQGNQSMDIKYIGFSTGWGTLGEFKIWKRDDADNSFTEHFHLGIPQSFVPGSERAVATVIGDVLGPSLNNLDNLLRLPFGCGEQNMIHFAPNVFVMGYLKRTKQLTEKKKETAMDYLVQGYQRQLTYKRSDGSYSAFGERDVSGSMWLTSFVLKSFAQSLAFIYIDPKEITDSKDWIMSKQQRDGSFPAIGKLINKDIQGGIQGKVSLTAYVVTALIESGAKTKEEKMCVNSAKIFLESKAHLVSDPYTAALCAYALTLLGSDKAVLALRKLNNMAIKQGGQTYWRLSGRSLQEDYILAFNDGLKTTVSSAEVEMTAYALLTYTTRGDIASALPVVKWLTHQRNSLGGFSSTQDTCVALQALSEYAVLAYSGQVNMTVTLASTNMDLQERITLNEENGEILQTAAIPSVPTRLFVSAEGNGCALLQIDVTYNIPDPSKTPSFKLDVKVGKSKHTPIKKKRPKRSAEDVSEQVTGEMKVQMETCVKWLHIGQSNMAVVEVSLLTGFRPDVESLEYLLQNKLLKVKRYEISGRKVIFYFDEIPNVCWTCITFEAFRSYVVGKTQPVSVRVYDYYEPAYESTVFYNASHIGVLAEELCDGQSCNEIKEKVEKSDEQSDDCNSPYGCYESLIKDKDKCLCYKACSSWGPRVCGSNGLLYMNKCYMEVEACKQGIRIDEVPIAQCNTGKTVSNVSLPGPDTTDDPNSSGDVGSGDETPLIQSTIKPVPSPQATVKVSDETDKSDYDYYSEYEYPTDEFRQGIIHEVEAPEESEEDSYDYMYLPYIPKVDDAAKPKPKLEDKSRGLVFVGTTSPPTDEPLPKFNPPQTIAKQNPVFLQHGLPTDGYAPDPIEVKAPDSINPLPFHLKEPVSPFFVKEPEPLFVKEPVPFYVKEPVPVNFRKPVPLRQPLPIHIKEPVPVHLKKPVPIHIKEPVPIHLNKPVPIHVKEPVPIHETNPDHEHLKEPVPVYAFPTKLEEPVPIHETEPLPATLEKEQFPIHTEEQLPNYKKEPVPIHEQESETVHGKKTVPIHLKGPVPFQQEPVPKKEPIQTFVKLPPSKVPIELEDQTKKQVQKVSIPIPKPDEIMTPSAILHTHIVTKGSENNNEEMEDVDTQGYGVDNNRDNLNENGHSDVGDATGEEEGKERDGAGIENNEKEVLHVSQNNITKAMPIVSKIDDEKEDMEIGDEEDEYIPEEMDYDVGMDNTEGEDDTDNNQYIEDSQNEQVVDEHDEVGDDTGDNDTVDENDTEDEDTIDESEKLSKNVQVSDENETDVDQNTDEENDQTKDSKKEKEQTKNEDSIENIQGINKEETETDEQDNIDEYEEGIYKQENDNAKDEEDVRNNNTKDALDNNTEN